MDTNKRPDTMERITTKELADQVIAEQVAAVQAQVGDKKVLLALSGGVDSSVVAALLIKAIGKQLVCVHVNHGLMRKGESEDVVEVFRNQLDANLVYIDATDRFLGLLEGVSDPEAKRKIIGGEFIKVFDEEAAKLRSKELVRRGLLLHDEMVLQAMEPGEEYRRLCCSVKKDGTLTGDLADREQLKLLKAYLFQILGQLVDDIASGNVIPNPYTRGSSHNACRYCPYGSICHSATVEDRRNYKMMSSQRFWDEIGKEVSGQNE